MDFLRLNNLSLYCLCLLLLLHFIPALKLEPAAYVITVHTEFTIIYKPIGSQAKARLDTQFIGAIFQRIVVIFWFV